MKVGGTLVGGLTVTEARNLVKQRFARPLTLVAGTGARVTVTPKELGATPDIDKAVNLAGRVQRAGFVVPLKVEVSQTKIERLVTSSASASTVIPSTRR